MKDFELTVLIREQEDVMKRVKDIEEIIKLFDGKVTKKQVDGLKTLAYEINGEKRANYIYFELTMPHNNALALSGRLNITHFVLRYLLIRSKDYEDERVNYQSY